MSVDYGYTTKQNMMKKISNVSVLLVILKMKQKTIIKLGIILLLIPTVFAYDNIDYYHPSINQTKYNTTIDKLDSIYNFSSYVPIIRVLNRTVYVNGRETCGRSFFSGVIEVSVSKELRCDKYFGRIIEHELRHSMFWDLETKTKLDYCYNNGFKYYAIDCWEYFANEQFSYFLTDEIEINEFKERIIKLKNG